MVVDNTRKAAKGLTETFTVLSDLAGTLRLQRRLKEMKPEIEAKMPKSGGVLVIAYIDETRIGEGTMRSLRSVRIEGAYASESEAKADLARPKLTAPTGPPAQRITEPNPFITTTPRYFWFRSPVSIPSLAKPKDLTDAESKTKQLLSTATQLYQSETARLDAEWEAIDAENNKLNDLRVKHGGKTSTPDEVAERGQQELARWQAYERHAIEAERAAANNTRQSAAAEHAAAAAMANERCPAGVTYEECEVHHDWKAAYRNRLAAHQSRAAQLDSQANQRAAAADARQARVDESKKNRQRAIHARMAEAEANKAAIESLRQQEEAFRQRLAEFDAEEEAVRQLEQTAKQIELQLSKRSG
ncbi:MAG: hypothetical protein WD847_00610 [Pirellulales bacterium]